MTFMNKLEATSASTWAPSRSRERETAKVAAGSVLLQGITLVVLPCWRQQDQRRDPPHKPTGASRGREDGL